MRIMEEDAPTFILIIRTYVQYNTIQFNLIE